MLVLARYVIILSTCCCISTYVLPWPLLQVSMLVKTKLMHADKVENGDMLVQVGNIAVENLTISKLMEIMATPSREIEGYGVVLTFKKCNGVVFRFLGETMKLSVDRMPVSISAGHDVGGIEVKVPAITSASKEDGMNLDQKSDPAILVGSA
jgi:hypothetical protein